MGLVAGQTYTFRWDQIDLPGNGALAGIKIESWNAGLISDSGDQLRATNAMWTTEEYDYTIDAAASHLKIVLVQIRDLSVLVLRLDLTTSAMLFPSPVP